MLGSRLPRLLSFLAGYGRGRLEEHNRLGPPRLVAEDFLDDLHHALAAQLGKADLVRGRIKQPLEQRFLELKRFPHSLFDALLGQQMDHLNRLGLSEPMHAADSLFEPRGVPRRLKVHHRRGRLQVQSHSTGVGREKDPAFRIVAEAGNQLAALSGGDASVQRNPAEF